MVLMLAASPSACTASPMSIAQEDDMELTNLSLTSRAVDVGGDMHDLYVVRIQRPEVWHKHIAVIIVNLQSKSPYCCYRQLHNNQAL